MANDIFDIFKKLNKERTLETSSPINYLVVGLGNPGEKYAFTKHNAGFLLLDYISSKDNFKINRSKYKSLCAENRVGDKRVLYLAPQTFMNNSGEAVAEAANFYKIPAENILVLFDDVSLPCGKMRIRRKGSDGGHNGIKSIIYHLQSDNFPRIKIGVGEKPHPEMDLADWVLSKFTDDEKTELKKVFDNAYNAHKMILNDEYEKAMGEFN